MALADPQSVTIGSAISLPRVGTGINAGAFSKDDGLVKLEIAHLFARNLRNRRTVLLTHNKVAADPLIAAQNLRYSMSARLTIDVPQVGYTVSEAKDVVTGLTTWLTASTNANLIKVLGGES